MNNTMNEKPLVASFYMDVLELCKKHDLIYTFTPRKDFRGEVVMHTVKTKDGWQQGQFDNITDLRFFILRVFGDKAQNDE